MMTCCHGDVPKTDLCQSRSSAAEQFMPAEQFRLKQYFAQWTLFKKYQFNFLIVLVVKLLLEGSIFSNFSAPITCTILKMLHP